MPDPDLKTLAWERLNEMMPPCDTCGQRLAPGDDADTPFLVCTPCTTITPVTAEWVEQQATAAWASVLTDPLRAETGGR